MSSKFKNLLYDNPEFYEALYPEARDETPTMCRKMFGKYLDAPPSSILDIGCGTGRDLRSLSKTCGDCVGVDFLPNVIEYARTRAPGIHFQVGDMRSVRLGRTFDVIQSFGSALLYALTDEDLDMTLSTYVAHAKPGSLLLLDLRNASALIGPGFRARIEGEVKSEAFSAKYVSEHSVDRRRQLLVRRRAWSMPDGSAAEDFCEYRLIFPREMESLLKSKGFEVVAMFDNRELNESSFEGPTMYVAARYRGSPRVRS